MITLLQTFLGKIETINTIEFLQITIATFFHILCSLVLYFVSNPFNRFIRYLLIRELLGIQTWTSMVPAFIEFTDSPLDSSSLLEKVGLNHHSFREWITSLPLSLLFAQELELQNSLFSFYPPDTERRMKWSIIIQIRKYGDHLVITKKKSVVLLITAND